MRSGTIAAVAFLSAACGSAPAVTPQIIYVTPEPAITDAPTPPTPPTPLIIYVTPAPTDAPTESPQPAPTNEPPATDVAPPPAGSGSGTFSDPYLPGTEFAVGDWTATVVSVDLDAWDEVRRENQFNDPPASGHTYVMFRLRVTNNGEEPENPWWDLSWEVVGSQGNTFDESCGVLPDAFSDVGRLFPGATGAGNECISVDEQQLHGALLSIRPLLSFTGEEVFVRLA